jgi:hypothetical protein
MTTIYGSVSAQGGGNTRPVINTAERAADTDEAIRRNNDHVKQSLRVALPAQVVSFDSDKQTIVAQPTIREKVINKETGTVEWIQLPQLVDVPVIFPGADNYVITFEPKAGDEVLLVFMDMCMDSWWFSGGVQNWNDRRRHDLSDAVALLGFRSRPNKIPDFKTDGMQIRQLEGSAKATIEPKTIDYLGVPVPYDDFKLEANNCSIEFKKTIKIVIIDGIPTPILMDTISIDGERVLINGVEI